MKLTLRDRFSAAANILRRGTFTMPVSEYRAEFPIGGITHAGVSVNATSAQKFSAVFACVRTYEQVMASLPIRITGLVAGKLSDIKDGDLYNLIQFPNKYLNRFTFFGLMNARVQLYGNAVAIITFNSKMVPIELTPVEWSSVNVRLINNRPVYVINDPDTGISGTFLDWQVIHFKINCRNGWVGMSPITAAREAIGLGLAAEGFGSDFFEKGGNVKGVLETEGHIPDKEFDAWKKRWDKYYGGSAGDHSTPVLEYGMKYNKLGISQNDAQFLETRVHQVQDVARFFGLPPSVIGENSRNTFTNGEQQDIQYVKYALSPICKSQETELEFKLLTRDNQEKIDIKYSLNSLLRGDMITRARFGQIMVQSGTYTRNEVREMEDKAPLEGLDKPLEPAFLTGKTDNSNSNSDGNNSNNDGNVQN
jgi:HK97 family phage portal protein